MCSLVHAVFHVQVKQFAGKDVYKGTFLPLLRVYRQDEDVEKLTRGTSRNICYMTGHRSCVSGLQRRLLCRLAGTGCTSAAKSPADTSPSYSSSVSSTA